MAKQREDIYISIDVESDGPLPFQNSMRSFGAAAFTAGGGRLREFYVALDPLPDAVTDPNTMEWWAQHPEAWDEVCKDTVDPERAMDAFHIWLKFLPTLGHGDILVPVCAPVGYDFLFIYSYLIKFCGDSPLGFSALDMRSYVMGGMKKRSWAQTSKRFWPKAWFKKTPKHSHHAMDDATEQGMCFMRARAQFLGLPEPKFERL